MMVSRLKRAALIGMGLMVFHIGLSVLMSLVAQSSHFLHYHNGQGIWNFALDSSLYHTEALRLLDLLRQGDYSAWWGSSFFWHVKWIALSYALLAPNPLSFAPINAIAWVMSIICVYQIASTLFPNNHKLASVSALSFGFWPSYLLHSTQLLKEPFYVIGVLLVIWGWVSLLTNNKGIGLSLMLGFGVLLASLNRTYILEPLLFLSLVGLGLVLWRSRGSWLPSLLAVLLVIGVCASIQQSPIKPRKKTETASRQRSYVAMWLRNSIQSTAYARDRFINKYPNAGSNIDTDVRFSSFSDILVYLPKAALIGFFAPFPNQWFEDAKTAGRSSRIIAGFEMVAWYLLMIGFLYCLATELVALHVRIWLVIFSTALVVLTSVVVTNIGALFRMRFVYFLPILIGGLEGWSRYLWARKKGERNLSLTEHG
jgi:hypothetical protein